MASSPSLAPSKDLHLQLKCVEHRKLHEKSWEVMEQVNSDYLLEGRKRHMSHYRCWSAKEPVQRGFILMQKDRLIKESTPNDIRIKEDLTSYLIPSEIPYRTETVLWHNTMAALLISSPTSFCVDHINVIGLKDGDLHNRVAGALRDGRCAVIHRAAEPGPEKLTLQYLHDQFGISDWLCSLHDMAYHAEDWTHFHEDGTIGCLLDEI
ncbi:uncharacterized protein F5147DRAFT_773852 [Suillus discolor]|uniref:Uncharacterized protein n=1 Tax=Suillus discolor TaxID=1912936 RepID=A0A9P7F876_9AGAM|nr:uncharacterized protein F5147DRAFT_773852 [Suillus discolor]KAG2108270.1 hypothetical protein F5147DRAFT_773852 [Suillus discolor]